VDRRGTPGFPSVQIALDHIGERILAAPLPARRYEDLQVGPPGIVYAIEVPDRRSTICTVYRWDLKRQKTEAVAQGASDVRMSLNGEKVLYRSGDRWIVTEPSGDKNKAQEKALTTEGIEVYVDPRSEWREMFHEVWRIERDFLHDPGRLHMDLKSAEERYEPYVDRIMSRQDLNYLFREMLGEFSVSHLSVRGGDFPQVKRVQTGLLGADYRVENGRYRFSRVYGGEDWNTDLRAPLTQPGARVTAGEYLLSVNGHNIGGTDNVYSRFENTVGSQVVLEVGSDRNGSDVRKVRVVPIAIGDEFKLRHRAWVEENRRRVEQTSNGRVAYVHMPDTGVRGGENFGQYFFAQVDKQAVIVDARFNSGGRLPSDIIEYLLRPKMMVISFRDGADWQLPHGRISGPKVLLTNEYTGSGGDILAWLFQRFGLGNVVGARTWGGVVAMTGSHELKDGGEVTAPSALIWNPPGKSDVENRGVTPDIEVELDPKDVREGKDPQLRRAVQCIVEMLDKGPAK